MAAGSWYTGAARIALEAAQRPVRNSSINSSQVLHWAARLIFMAAIAGALLNFHRGRSAAKTPRRVVSGKQDGALQFDWASHAFQPWRSQVWGVSLQAPEGWAPSEVFDRFTKRPIGGLTAYDVVALRSAKPRSVIALVRYESPQPLSWEEWQAAFRAPAPEPLTNSLRAEFGAGEVEFTSGQLQGRPALFANADGGVTFPMRGNYQVDMWRFRSVLIADGQRAFRLTCGADARQFDAVAAGFEKTLQSLSWQPETALKP